MSKGPNSRLQIPGQLKVNCHHQDGPTAHPITTAVPTQGGLELLAFGGLTKLEYIAGQIAGHIELRGLHVREYPNVEAAVPVERIASASVSLAEAVLAECQKRQTAIQPGE